MTAHLRAILRGLLAAVLAGACLAPALAQDRTAAELKKLQGTWIVTASERNGKADNAIKGGTLTLSGHAFALHTAAGNDLQGEFTINPSASPRQIDFVHADGTVWQAIYAVDHDVFKLNYVDASGRDPRPTIFATSADSQAAIVVMRKSTATGGRTP
jgi:uncharacterized protein (TIGR03067 family)